MNSILRVFDKTGKRVDLPAIRGEKGDQGDPGVYVLKEGETIEDAPASALLVFDPYNDPPMVEMTATLEDGTTKTISLYGEVDA